METEGRPVTTDRQRRWSGSPAPVSPVRPAPAVLSPAESRREAKRLLGRDSAIILVGIVVALLVLNYLPALAPGLAASGTEGPGGDGAGGSLVPARSVPPAATVGPVIDPGLGVGATAHPGLTLPPTGSSAPIDPDSTSSPTPRPTKRPPATSPPGTSSPTEAPTPEATPEPTQPPTDPPPTDPAPTDPPPSEPT